MTKMIALVIFTLLFGCTSTLDKIAHQNVYPFKNVNEAFSMAEFSEVLEEPWRELRLGREGRIHAVYAELDITAPWVIYFHGNGENLEALRQARMLDALPMLQQNVIVIDYPGLGNSQGEVNEDGLTEAGLLAYDWVAARAISHINVVGRSLGAAVAAQVANQREVRNLVLISPWKDLKTLALEKLDLAKRVSDSFWEANAWNTMEISPKATFMLIVHGTQDTVIPYKHGAAVAGQHNAVLYAVENTGHNDIFSSGEVFALLSQVLQM